MKTTKIKRDHVYLCAHACFQTTGSWKYGTGDTAKLIMDLIDDLDELESRLARAEAENAETLAILAGKLGIDVSGTFEEDLEARIVSGVTINRECAVENAVQAERERCARRMLKYKTGAEHPELLAGYLKILSPSEKEKVNASE